jgi:hypothetical protein
LAQPEFTPVDTGASVTHLHTGRDGTVPFDGTSAVDGVVSSPAEVEEAGSSDLQVGAAPHGDQAPVGNGPVAQLGGAAGS